MKIRQRSRARTARAALIKKGIRMPKKKTRNPPRVGPKIIPVVRPASKVPQADPRFTEGTISETNASLDGHKPAVKNPSAPRAINRRRREFDNPNTTSEMLDPTSEMRIIGFRPTRSDKLPNGPAARKAKTEKVATSNPYSNAPAPNS
jgi:hypothetical protein